MNDQKYRTAAWLVFIKLGTGLFMFVTGLILVAAKNWTPAPVAVRGFILVLTAVLNFFILMRLRRLLWDRYDFHKLDILIPIVAGADIVLEILNQCTEMAQVLNPGEAGKIIALRILFVIVPYGAVNLVYAAGLLKLPFSEKSLLRPYAFLNLAAGIVLISMILVLISPIFGLFLFALLLLTGVGSDVFLALTFLRSRETEQVEFV